MIAYCVMCLSISPDRRFIREAVFHRDHAEFIEPFQIIVPLTVPLAPLDQEDVPIPMSDDDPLFHKWCGALKRMTEDDA